MSLCFGGRRRTRHRQSRRSEKDRLLVDEPRVIVNPCFRDSGKTAQHGDDISLVLHLIRSLQKHQHTPDCVCVCVCVSTFR